jgi:hypothetical protein
VAWYLNLNERRLGWALSEVNRQTIGVTEIHNLVHIDKLPLDQLLHKILPFWVQPLVGKSVQAFENVEMDVESQIMINPIGQLQGLEAKVKLFPNEGQSLVNINGTVDGDSLVFDCRFGSMQQKVSVPLPENKIRDSFSPETELRGLHRGQKWTIVTFSPLSLPNNPLELLQRRSPTAVLMAEVEDKVPVTWNGRTEPTWLVVYRSDASPNPGSEDGICNRMWVRMDGTVIREEVLLFGNRLMFNRMADKEAAELRSRRKEFFIQQL